MGQDIPSRAAARRALSMQHDVTLIAGCREAPLTRTLECVTRDVFPHFPIRRLIANIDPFMGDTAEGDRCAAPVTSYVHDALIFRPEAPRRGSRPGKRLLDLAPGGDGGVLRRAAQRMRPRLDPEKQFYRQTNPELEAFALPKRCMFLRGTAQRSLIMDIGRAARAAEGLVKRYENGASVWRKG